MIEVTQELVDALSQIADDAERWLAQHGWGHKHGWAETDARLKLVRAHRDALAAKLRGQ